MIYESILEQLSTQKCKLTLQRRELLKILIRAKTPLAAREIYDRMMKKYPSMSFDTVYRNLSLLQDPVSYTHLTLPTTPYV
jgi:Fe2+ or Zn2+ uptake regulation protein